MNRGPNNGRIWSLAECLAEINKRLAALPRCDKHPDDHAAMWHRESDGQTTRMVLHCAHCEAGK